MELIKRIEELVQDVVKENNCYIDDIEYVQENGDWYLRIYIDLIEGSIDLDTCVAVSEKVSEILDEADPIEGEYILEVSSPGCERPLKTFEAVQKNVGEYVYIKLRNPKAGLDNFYGTILSIEGTEIEVQYMVKNIKKKIVVDYSNISFIRLAVKF